MERDAGQSTKRRPWLRLVKSADAGAAGSPADLSAVDAGEAPRKFQVLFQLPEPGDGLWGDSFRGTYTLAAILEIVAAYDSDGVRLRCLFLEDRLGDDLATIDAAFEVVRRGGDKRWAAVYAVDPMFFAVAKNLNRAAVALALPDTFTPDPDQVIEGSINAMGAVLRYGFDTNIVLTLLLSDPRPETLAGALEEIRRRRLADPDTVNMHQQFCCGAVVSMLEDELAIGGRFRRCAIGDVFEASLSTGEAKASEP